MCAKFHTFATLVPRTSCIYSSRHHCDSAGEWRRRACINLILRRALIRGNWSRDETGLRTARGALDIGAGPDRDPLAPDESHRRYTTRTAWVANGSTIRDLGNDPPKKKYKKKEKKIAPFRDLNVRGKCYSVCSSRALGEEYLKCI